MSEKEENKPRKVFSQLMKTVLRETMINQRLKPLIPTLREKNRYIAFEIVSKTPIQDITIVSKEIWRQTLQLYGEIETAKSALWVLPETWDEKKQCGILKVVHTHVPQLKASLALISIINNQEVIIQTKFVSGILRKTIEKNKAG